MESGFNTSRSLSSSFGCWEEFDEILRKMKTASSSASALATSSGSSAEGSNPLFRRQSSWPVPERTPHLPLPSSSFMCLSQLPNEDMDISTNNDASAMFVHPEEENTEELLKFFFSLPPEWRAKMINSCRTPANAHSRRARVQKRSCRFCLSNGERYEIYTSHELKDHLGRVVCPVLRAYECPRCKSTGDYAHTIRYCPFSTYEERAHSLGLNVGLRMASGRLRQPKPGQARPAREPYSPAPLNDGWAELEKKLNRY